MITRVTLTLEDDLDGGPADETLRFSLAGSHYEIDLNASNAAAFRRQLASFIDHARASGANRRPARTASSRRRSEAIRGWAKEHGIAVSARGRIAADVIDRYEAAVRPRRRERHAGAGLGMSSRRANTRESMLAPDRRIGIVTSMIS